MPSTMMRFSRASVRSWRSNFFAGLAVVLPAVISIAVVLWLFGTVANITDALLFFLPRGWTHERGGEGPVFWYWSMLALLWTVLIVTFIGRFARNYFGRQLIEWVDGLLESVPLLNKIYGTVKQVNEAFGSGKKSSFKQVVLIEYPRKGVYSVGFITSEDLPEATAKTGQCLVGVFVPTTPNPTGGFLLAVPRSELVLLDMSVADGIKYVISLGAVVPVYDPPPGGVIGRGSPVVVAAISAPPTATPTATPAAVTPGTAENA